MTSAACGTFSGNTKPEFFQKFILGTRHTVEVTLNVIGLQGGDLCQFVLGFDSLHHQAEADAVYHADDMYQKLEFIFVLQCL